MRSPIQLQVLEMNKAVYARKWGVSPGEIKVEAMGYDQKQFTQVFRLYVSDYEYFQFKPMSNTGFEKIVSLEC